LEKGGKSDTNLKGFTETNRKHPNKTNEKTKGDGESKTQGKLKLGFRGGQNPETGQNEGSKGN